MEYINKMNFLVDVISAALIPIITLTVINYMRKIAKAETMEMSYEFFEVHLPKAISILFFSCFGIFGVLLIIMATVGNNETAVWWVYLVFGGFALASLLVGIIVIRWKVVVNGEEIKVYPLFGSVKSYQFSQITHVVYNPKPYRNENMIKVYCGRKQIFEFSDMYKGYEFMHRRLADKNLI